LTWREEGKKGKRKKDKRRCFSRSALASLEKEGKKRKEKREAHAAVSVQSPEKRKKRGKRRGGRRTAAADENPRPVAFCAIKKKGEKTTGKRNWRTLFRSAVRI